MSVQRVAYFYPRFSNVTISSRWVEDSGLSDTAHDGPFKNSGTHVATVSLPSSSEMATFEKRG